MKSERGKWHTLAHPLEIYISRYPDKISTQRLVLKERPLRVLCESTAATLRGPEEGRRGLIKVEKANPARPERSPRKRTWLHPQARALPPTQLPTDTHLPHLLEAESPALELRHHLNSERKRFARRLQL